MFYTLLSSFSASNLASVIGTSRDAWADDNSSRLEMQKGIDSSTACFM